MIIIFSGSIGRFSVGGHAWVNIQYLAGLKALGHDVYYMEDCGDESGAYDWMADDIVEGIDRPGAFIHDCLEPFGFSDRWIYRTTTQSCGLTIAEFREICARADLLIIRAVPLAAWRPEYSWPKRRIFVDVDPGFTQVSFMAGDALLQQTFAHCERLFSIAQRIGAEDCWIPDCGRCWEKTLSPVWIPAWPLKEQDAGPYFSTILQWKSFGRLHAYGGLEHDGMHLGQKGEEFAKFLELPKLTGQPFRVALEGGSAERLSRHGWDVVPGWRTTRSTGLYRDYVQQSRAEFGVAKHGYVASRGGWFSDRSVCYLASGKPVLIQDTGLRDWLPIGQGVSVFRDLQEARRGVERINEDYAAHCRAARTLAKDYFSTDRVLSRLLDVSMG